MEVEQLREDALMRLAKYETVFLLDDSWSMTEGDPSRWEQTVKACTSLAANVSRYSPDGFEIRTLNCGRSGRCKARYLSGILMMHSPVSPSGSTPLGERLTEILEAYDQKLYATMDFTMKRILRSPLPKPLNCIVITDGKPDNQRLVEDLIIETATRLKDTRAPLTQIGIQFVQIGDDKNASEWLEKLDDKIKVSSSASKGVWTRYELQNQVWDIVDTCRYKSSSKKVDFEKILLGAINRRIDKLQKT
ncbi:hypothetical protein BXZ70DRAFT_895928 [Cristinia sonorae]|uniref:VWFA domain-containing protein n=1 Tax=Cristinia sonorae TaxID=1940300 RepID=A0A8K0UKZ6_9AGAR|nr:hypothetical protein BXZ70DRAFT_895928 [Cristinia sonorae]